MPTKSAATRHVGVALAILLAMNANQAVAQNRVGGGGGAIATGGPAPAGGGRGFPVGLGIGLGIGAGLGLLGVLLNSREPPVEPPVSDIPSREPPTRPSRPTRIVEQVGPPVRIGRPPIRRETVMRRQGVGRTATPAERPGFVVPAATERRFSPDEILVETKSPVAAAALRRLEASLALTPIAVARIGLLDADVRLYRIKPGASVGSTIRALRGQRVVAEAEPNFAFELQDDAAPSPDQKPPAAADTPKASKDADAATPVQYAVAALHLIEAHRLSTGADVRVAIIDSGLDETNPNLEDSIVDRFDAIGGTFVAQAHGTAMAGAIVAHKTLVGVAPGARLIAIRAFAASASKGVGSGFNVLRGLDFAAAHASRIVNMSFAGPQDLLLRQALAAARSRGIIAIAAAGNGGPSSRPLYPAAEGGVIAVTATDVGGKLFGLANRGAYIAIAAPGVDIIAPGLGGSVQITTGTSVAAAEASGVAALVLARRPKATPDDIRGILRRTARPLTADTAAGGVGLIDAAAAVQADR